MSRKKLYSLCTCEYLCAPGKKKKKRVEKLEKQASMLSLPCTETYHHGGARWSFTACF